MDAKKFKDDLAELLKKHQLLPQRPGCLQVVSHITAEQKVGSVKIISEHEIR